jgi:hypothetical protein
MTQQVFLSIYEEIIVGSRVEGFRLAGQFPVLQLWNEKENYEIEFHIDCRITSNSQPLNNLVNQLARYDKEVYEIAYFFGINLTIIKSIAFTKEDNLKVLFSNDIELIFKLNDTWIEPLNISIMKNDKYLKGCRLLNDRTIQL